MKLHMFVRSLGYISIFLQCKRILLYALYAIHGPDTWFKLFESRHASNTCLQVIIHLSLECPVCVRTSVMQISVDVTCLIWHDTYFEASVFHRLSLPIPTFLCLTVFQCLSQGKGKTIFVERFFLLAQLMHCFRYC